jgi:hypothetical protein
MGFGAVIAGQDSLLANRWVIFDIMLTNIYRLAKLQA